MSHLNRAVSMEGADTTARTLVSTYTGHMGWGIRDVINNDVRVPCEASLTRAALLAQTGSPSEMGKLAAWMDLLALLAEKGWTRLERLELVLEVFEGPTPGNQIPPHSVICHAVEGLTPDDVRPIVRRLGTKQDGDSLCTVMCALPMLDAGEPAPDAIDKATLWHAPPAALRRVLKSLDPNTRDAVLVRLMTTTNSNAAHFFVQCVCFIVDFCHTPAVAGALAKLRRTSLGTPGIERLYTLIDAGGVGFDRIGLSEIARPNLDYWLDMLEDARRARGLGPVAEHAVTRRIGVADAAELASVDAWAAATDGRREAVAKAVLAAIGAKRFRFVGLRTYDTLPVAVFAHRRKKTLLSLLPGGAFDQGFSEVEEETLRAAAANASWSEPYEEFGQLIDQLSAMRPVRHVAVGPMLVGQGPGVPIDSSRLVTWLSRGPWRLPTESEWEYAARGGGRGKLTHRGDELPRRPWFETMQQLGDKAANPFGLWGFGDRPEICADLWRPGYHGAPTDGGPVTGEGPRAVRGGAGELFPWQEGGEWHLLLTAMRSSEEAWSYGFSVRPVIGIRVHSD